jgi:hypothetical protein
VTPGGSCNGTGPVSDPPEVTGRVAGGDRDVDRVLLWNVAGALATLLA